jgi:hypothetical protein
MPVMSEQELARCALAIARHFRVRAWADFSPDLRVLVERAYYQEWLAAFPQYQAERAA